MKQLIRNRYYALPLIAVLVFSVSLLVGLGKLLQESREDRANAEELIFWSAVQTEVEYWRFLESLDRYAMGTADRDDVLTRLDILWSRIYVFKGGDIGRRLMAMEGASETVPALSAALRAVEPMILALKPGDPVAFQAIRDRLGPHGVPLFRMVQRTSLREQHRTIDFRQKTARTYWVLGAFLLGILAAGIGLIVLMIREIRHANRALAATSAAEERAQDVANHLTAVLDSAVTSIITIDVKGIVTSFNPAAEKLFAYRAEEVISRNVSMLMPEPYHQAHDGYIANYLGGGKPGVIGRSRLVTARRKDGHSFPMELSVGEMRSGGARYFVGFITDMTERVEAGKAQRESEERLRAVMDNSPALMYIKDDQGRYLEVNRRFEDLWGVRNEETRGRLPTDFHRQEGFAEIARSQDLAVLEFGRVMEKENEFLLDDGMHIFHSIKFPLRDSTGKIFGLGGISTDITERKRAEKALQASEQRFRDVADVAGDWIWETDADLRYTYFSEQMEKITGLSARGLLGKTRLELPWADASDPKWRRHAEDLKALRPFRDFRFAVSLTDGRVTHMRVSGKPVFDDEENFQGYRGTGTDITAQVEAEAEAARQAALFQGIIENAVEGIFKTAADGRYLSVNPALARMHGCESVEEFLTCFPNGSEAFADAAAREELLGRIREEGFVRGFEYQGKKRDGTRFWISESARAVRDEDGILVGHEGFVEDITERKSMRNTAEQLGSILDRSWNEIYVFDAETLRFVRANEAARRNLGYSAEEMTRLTPLDLKPLFTTESFANLIAPLRDGDKEQVVIETVHRRKDGTEYPVEVRLQISRFESPPVFVAIILDISQRKETEEQLRQAQKMEAIGRLTGGVAHEFNNQLFAIGGFARLLQRSDIASDLERMWLNNIVTATDQATSLTRKLLAFSRNDSPVPEIVPIGGVLREAEVLLRPIMDRPMAASIDIHFDIAEEHVGVKVDSRQFTQAVLNLAINACDAMPEGGTLTITSRTVDLDASGVAGSEMAEPGRYVAISVADTGTGIDKAIMEKIFEPFFTTKEVGKGTGLGLSMVYGMVQQSGGVITVDSEIGQGATFTIYLPLQLGEARTAKKAAGCEAAPGGGETILIAEDEPTVQQLTQASLEKLGYTVLVAADGLQAAETFRSHKGRVDLLLADVKMPGLNGRELSRRLIAEDPRLKVVYMTGYEHLAKPKDIQGRDGDEILLQKPFDPDDLGRVVRYVLDGR